MEEDGLENPHFEYTNISNWVHNPLNDRLVMTSPYLKPMAVLPLGYSISASGLEADVVVVKSFDELDAVDARGKIVVYNVPFTTYSATVAYRSNGAARASEAGAVASLTRSVTSRSLYTPHTGVQRYGESTPIPAGAITIEDAEFLQNLQDQGVTPKLSLTLDSENLPDNLGRNVVAELRGSDLPEEFVVIGGHIDSWDVGTGAMDDAGGVFHAWQAIRLLKMLDYIPRRTIRLVLWTAEENGGAGNREYYREHSFENNQTVFCLESDSGTFTPSAWRFQGNPGGLSTVQEISNLMSPTLNMKVFPGGAGADVDILIRQGGVPGVGLDVQQYENGKLVPDKYFDYHHTNADTIDHIDIDDFRKCVGAVASLVYVIADMEGTLPRG